MQRVARLGLERGSVLAGSAEQLVLADHMVGVAHARSPTSSGRAANRAWPSWRGSSAPGEPRSSLMTTGALGPLRPGWPAPRGVAGPIRTVSKRSGTSRASRRPGWRASAGSTAERTWRRCWATSSRPSWPSSSARSTRAWWWRSTTASTIVGTEPPPCRPARRPRPGGRAGGRGRRQDHREPAQDRRRPARVVTLPKVAAVALAAHLEAYAEPDMEGLGVHHAKG
jgi:hypothetical protein